MLLFSQHPCLLFAIVKSVLSTAYPPYIHRCLTAWRRNDILTVVHAQTVLPSNKKKGNKIGIRAPKQIF